MPVVRTSTGKEFAAEAGESVLAAALRADVTMPYSCRTGRCSSCKGRVLSGQTRALEPERVLTPAEREEGWILTCVTAAASDLLLASQDLAGVELARPRLLPCRIASLEPLNEHVLKAVLRLPPRVSLPHLPGQYVDVIAGGGLRRSYSIANAPGADATIELHVARVPDGAMSRYWFELARVNDLLRLEGPLGTFVLHGVDDLDLVFLATGTGIAPVKAMLEQLSGGQPRPRSVRVFWGGRVPSDLYWDPGAVAAGQCFTPVLSRADTDWHGARGHVQQAFLAERAAGTDWSRTLVLACGSPAMIESASALLLASGLEPGRFRSDAFVCSSPDRTSP